MSEVHQGSTREILRNSKEVGRQKKRYVPGRPAGVGGDSHGGLRHRVSGVAHMKKRQLEMRNPNFVMPSSRPRKLPYSTGPAGIQRVREFIEQKNKVCNQAFQRQKNSVRGSTREIIKMRKEASCAKEAKGTFT